MRASLLLYGAVVVVVCEERDKRKRTSLRDYGFVFPGDERAQMHFYANSTERGRPVRTRATCGKYRSLFVVEGVGRRKVVPDQNG